uniref:Uncharacterized protein n=1 Tax=Rhizophora mucronata TaxID=61149 RepID=A0A2P2P6L6_RHIMU
MCMTTMSDLWSLSICYLLLIELSYVEQMHGNKQCLMEFDFCILIVFVFELKGYQMC